MLQKTLVVLILMVLALGIADARVPKVGDKVAIETAPTRTICNHFSGEITDIENGLICLHTDKNSACSMVDEDICIGIGSII